MGEKVAGLNTVDRILIWSELSIPLFILVLVLVLILVLMVVFLSRVERVAIEIAFATVDQSDIRGSKPHNRDPSGAASH
jgi:5-bromo-4-chloroindolyl phosphate hydrolysis protein